MTRRLDLAELVAGMPVSLQRLNAPLASAKAAFRVTGGAGAREAGEVFEAWIATELDALERVGRLAWWRHVGPRVRWVGKGAAARPRAVGVGPADYVGQLAGGRALVLEAKSRAERLSWRDIEEHQRVHLDACARGGGLAAVLYEHRSGGRVERFAVPWSEVPWRTGTRASHVTRTVGPTDLGAWAVGRAGLVFDARWEQ